MIFGSWKIPTGVAIFLFFFSVYLVNLSGRIQFGDEVEKYLVAQSLVERHEFSFRPTAARNETGVDSRTYSIYELGQTLFEVPLYVLGKLAFAFFPVSDSNWITMLFVGLLNPILTALTCLLVFRTSSILGFRHRTALFLTIVFGIGTIALPYSKSFTREPLLAFLLLLTLYATLRFSKTPATHWLMVAGLFSGYLAFTKLIHAIVIPVVLTFLLFVIFQNSKSAGDTSRNTLKAMVRGLGVFLLPALVFVVLQGIYSYMRFGNIYSGIAGTRENLIVRINYLLTLGNPVAAITGLLFSSDKSLFLYSLPVILFPIACFQWFRQERKIAGLFLSLILVELAAVIVRIDWDGGSWWGPRYLVQIIPLLILPLGVLLDSPNQSTRRFWAVVLVGLTIASTFVQIVGVSVNDRDYLDTFGKPSNLIEQLDFFWHGAIDSLVITLVPTEQRIQINPFGVVLAIIIAIFALWIARNLRQGAEIQTRPARGWVLLVLILAIESAGFLFGIVREYPKVLAAHADTKFVAANQFLADGKRCQAIALYLLALERGSNYQREAIAKLNEIAPRAQGEEFTADELLANLEASKSSIYETDLGNSLLGAGSLKIRIPSEQETARAVTAPYPVQPNTFYELSGWMRTENVYGAGYAVVSVSEDDGFWRNARVTDIATRGETGGWGPFSQAIRTLPTTRRIFIATGLLKTFGTVWIEGIQLAQVANEKQSAMALPLTCK